MKIRFYPQLNRDIGDVEFETEKDWVNFVTAIKANLHCVIPEHNDGGGVGYHTSNRKKTKFFFPN